MGLTQADIDKWLAENPDLAIEGTPGGGIAIAPGTRRPETFEDVLWHVIEDQRAVMRTAPPELKFKSKTEERAWEQWVPTTGCVTAHYEGIRVYLQSGSYQPDFNLYMPDGELWLIEVKGTWNAYQSGRSSRKSLIEAASVHWRLGQWFSLLPAKGGGWNLEEITPKMVKELV
jgi:hypothetical protein